MATPGGGLSASMGFPMTLGFGTPPASAPLSPRGERTPATGHLTPRILNGVSGEEEVRFQINLQVSKLHAELLHMLDRLCHQHLGHNLPRLRWLVQSEPGGRFQRRPC